MMILLTMLLGATAFTDTYTEGAQAYENQHYTQAIEQYESLVYNRVYEAEVFYNLGNAYFQHGDHAAAIVNYERALRIDPSLRVARDNVQQVVGLTQQKLPRPQSEGWKSSLYFWHGSFKTSTSFSLALLFWVLMWSGLVVRIVYPKKYLRGLSLGCGLVAILFLGSWQLKSHPMELAVAQGDSIPVRIGTKDTDTVRFELFSGDRVKVSEHKGDQVLIHTAKGERGWVDAVSLIPVWPPERSTEK